MCWKSKVLVVTYQEAWGKAEMIGCNLYSNEIRAYSENFGVEPLILVLWNWTRFVLFQEQSFRVLVQAHVRFSWDCSYPLRTINFYQPRPKIVADIDFFWDIKRSILVNGLKVWRPNKLSCSKPRIVRRSKRRHPISKFKTKNFEEIKTKIKEKTPDIKMGAFCPKRK